MERETAYMYLHREREVDRLIDISKKEGTLIIPLFSLYFTNKDWKGIFFTHLDG